ncbi:hypothetical protein Tco_0142570, partial [Tanacetum coccineum]
DKTESERDSDHDESDNDSEHGDASDKSASDQESVESDKSDKDFNNNDARPEDFMIKPHDKEPEQPLKELPLPSPSVTTALAEDYTRYLNDPKERLTNLEKRNHADIIEESVQANVLNEVRNQLLKFLPKAVFEYVQPRLDERFVIIVVHFLLMKNNILINSMGIDESDAI